MLSVTRLDRLTRSTRDLLNVLHEIGEEARKGDHLRPKASTMRRQEIAEKPATTVSELDARSRVDEHCK